MNIVMATDGSEAAIDAARRSVDLPLRSLSERQEEFMIGDRHASK